MPTLIYFPLCQGISRKGPLYIIKAYCRRCCRPRERVYCKILQGSTLSSRLLGVFYTFSAGVGLSSCKNIKKYSQRWELGGKWRLLYIQCSVVYQEQNSQKICKLFCHLNILITYKNIYIYLCNLLPKYIHITSRSISVMCDIDISSCWWIRL